MDGSACSNLVGDGDRPRDESGQH
eukprot:gene27229-biopygen17762